MGRQPLLMRVAFDIAQTAAERAGCAWYADGLARALAQRPDVTLDLYGHFGTWINTSAAHASTIAGTNAPLASAGSDEARAFWVAAATHGLPGQPEIVHSNSFEAPAVAGSRLVFTIHDLSFWTHPDFSSEATRQVCQTGVLDALERAAGIAFVSRAARDQFETILPHWIERTCRPWCIIPGASRFAPEPCPSARRTDAPWLCVGSIEPRKNHATLLEAHRLYRHSVREPRALHLVGGRGWHSDDLHQQLSQSKPEEGVVHRGYVSDEHLAEAYRGAFALIQPSWHEGFGLPVVEAGGFGIPVICSDIPSLHEVAAASAMYFDPRSAKQLAAHLVALHNDAAAHGVRARASAQNATRFSWDISAARCVDFYQTLLD